MFLINVAFRDYFRVLHYMAHMGLNVDNEDDVKDAIVEVYKDEFHLDDEHLELCYKGFMSVVDSSPYIK